MLELSGEEKIKLGNMLISLSYPVEVVCNYKNWRGEESERRFCPVRLWYGSTDWHPEAGLMLEAVDLDKSEKRDFRIEDFDLLTLRKNDDK